MGRPPPLAETLLVWTGFAAFAVALGVWSMPPDLAALERWTWTRALPAAFVGGLGLAYAFVRTTRLAVADGLAMPASAVRLPRPRRYRRETTPAARMVRLLDAATSAPERGTMPWEDGPVEVRLTRWQRMKEVEARARRWQVAVAVGPVMASPSMAAQDSVPWLPAVFGAVVVVVLAVMGYVTSRMWARWYRDECMQPGTMSSALPPALGTGA